MNKKNILVVDDSEFVRKIVQAELGGNYNVIQAENGKEALELLYTNAVSLIICDIIMPIMDGYEFVKLIKNDDNLKNIPVIMLTTESYDYTKSDFEKLGVAEYLVKPINSEKLNEVINKVLS